MNRLKILFCSVFFVVFSFVVNAAEENEWMKLSRESMMHYGQGQYGKAALAGKKALDAGEEKYGRESRQAAVSLNNLAEIYRADGRLAEAEPLFRRALEINEKIEAGFRCNCSRERIEKALISIGRKELETMEKENKPIEVGCHFCNKKYNFNVNDIEQILEEIKSE